MLSRDQQDQIFHLLDNGMSASQISRQLHISIGTVYNYRNSRSHSGNTDSHKEKIPSKILPFRESIRLRLKRGEKNITRIFQYLQKEGYLGSYALLNSYVRNFLLSFRQKKYKRSTRVETDPGEQAQIDWGDFGKVVINGRKEKLYAFIYILSYSRMAYVEFVVRQKQVVLQNCHVRAFEKIGMPKVLRYDNMKTVLVRRKKLPNGYKKLYWNPSFQEFAKYYGFELDICPPYWPRSKGKVEAMVKYLKQNFADGNVFKKNFISLENLNKEVSRWLDEVANARIHRTTKEKPCNLWKKEKPFLIFPNGFSPYNPTPLLPRRSTKDGLIQYKSVFYSVPMDYAQKKLYIREIDNSGLPILEIYDHHESIARHSISTKRGSWVLDDQHLSTKNEGEVPKKKIKEMASISVAARDLHYYDIVG
ncbi:MAG: IS21 family transposase [Candidatus Kerfeldbacteria bacterium]|nr:IS21 family transposase [Candidatus Kerfeldbacteria bacterium]